MNEFYKEYYGYSAVIWLTYLLTLLLLLTVRPPCRWQQTQHMVWQQPLHSTRRRQCMDLMLDMELV